MMNSTFRRKIFSIALCLLAIVPTLSISPAHKALGGAAPKSTKPVESHPQLGINLASPSCYGGEYPFVDYFRLNGAWISQRKGTPWGKGPPLELDKNGWVTRLEPGCWVDTPACATQSYFPSGLYTVLYDGEGAFKAFGSAVLQSQRPGRVTLEVDPSKGGFFLQIMETKPENYVRNIRILPPGSDNEERGNPWRKEFLDRWRGMACLRYMDMMFTNNSPIVSWTERPKIEDATYTTKGVPLELLIDLANRLNASPWFCIPHKADDDYVRNFAAMVKGRLKPELKFYLEYSNEVWNNIFQQSKYAGEQGIKLGFAKTPWEGAWKYTAYRSVQIFKLFEEIFGDTQRFVRVLPSQAANSYATNQILTFQDAYKHADAVAIAPYITFMVGNAKAHKLYAEDVATWNADKLFDYLEATALPECERWMRANHKVAEDHGLKLIAYEGGQHLAGIMGAENNNKLTEVLTSANRHPRMGKLYTRYYEAWQNAGGDLFCHFNSVMPSTKWGSWGLIESTTDDRSRTPKYVATIQWGKSLGQPLVIQEPTKPIRASSRARPTHDSAGTASSTSSPARSSASSRSSSSSVARQPARSDRTTQSSRRRSIPPPPPLPGR